MGGEALTARLAAVVLASALASACATAPKRMRYAEVASPAMGRPMSYALYTPPGWTRGEALPMFVFLHGGGDAVDCLDKEGITAWLDAQMQAGKVPRATFAVPQGDQGFWANWADGTHRYQDWVVDELLPRAAEELGAPACPEGCHLIGISMGGNGALRLVLERPGHFASVTVLSGPTFDSRGMERMMGNFFLRTFGRLERIFGKVTDEARKRRADPFLQWQSAEDVGALKLFIAHGSDDRAGIGDTNLALHRHLDGMQVPHRYEVFPGGHTWEAWTPVFGEAIRYAVTGN